VDFANPPRGLTNSLDFSDPRAAYQSKSLGELLLAYVVFRACLFPPLVANSDRIYKTARRVLGPTLVDGVVRRTFFAHFCGGENEATLEAKVGGPCALACAHGPVHAPVLVGRPKCCAPPASARLWITRPRRM
jgi:hypothetical protein